MFSLRFSLRSADCLFPLTLAMLLLATSSGCSVMMAAKGPGKKDLAVLTPGMARAKVIAELGSPLETSGDAIETRDIFAFKQGYSTPTRVGRAGLHAVADVMTYGLWEIAATPLEGALDGEDVRAEVIYGPQEQVRRVEFFAGAHLANGGPTLAPWLRSKSTRQTAIVESAARSIEYSAGNDLQQPNAVETILER